MPKKKYDPSKITTDPLYGMLTSVEQEKHDEQETSETHERPETQEVSIIQETPINGETPKDQKARLKRSVAESLKKYRGNKNGDKLDRIGMAFLPGIYDYIRTMSAAEGMTLTGYVNLLVSLDMERNGDRYRAIKAALNDE